MTSTPDHNPNITCEISDDASVKLVVACRNMANAARDDQFSPLAFRISDQIEDINKMEPQPDVFCCLEAGRPSKDMSWTSMASKIEDNTRLRLECTIRINATPMSFAKALFINPERAAVSSVEQVWTSDRQLIWSGEGFGNDVIIATIHPVLNRKVVTGRSIRVGFVHLPMKLEARMQVSKWLNDNADLVDMWIGDCNTFPDDGGQAMIDAITADSKLVERTPKDTPFTFSAFPHDTISVANEKLDQIGEHSKVVEHGETHSSVLYSSVLDRIFATPTLRCTGFACPPTFASDHCIMYAEVEF